MRSNWQLVRKKRGLTFGRAVLIGSALFGAFVTFRSLPDLRRYLRMERM